MRPPERVVFTAAHGGYAGERAPLGGGAAIAEWLSEEWSGSRPFEVRLITPSILGAGAPSARDLVALDERDYARFCRTFERAATEAILAEDPATTAVLANDVAEGPDFARIAAAGFRLYTIFHVDVVAYIAAIYLRGWFRPETLVRWHRKWGRRWPDIAQLIFAKQWASVAWSTGVIVPSGRMKEVLCRCYPGVEAGRIHVVPWGAPPERCSEEEVSSECERLRSECGIAPGVPVVLALSRISPEKGQDRLLRALAGWPSPLLVFVCGEAAFMRGARFEKRLRALARRTGGARVLFPGYVTGARKQALFRLADLYVFPSRHESYGLTLMEALAAGCPALCLDHAGAEEIMRPELGWVVAEDELRSALAGMLADGEARRRMSAAARSWAAGQPFARAAARVAEIIRGATACAPASGCGS